jgi:hypothetical protein
MARHISVTLHRLHGKTLRPVWTRKYARIDTAIPRMSLYLALEGEVGDVVEFHLTTNGMQVGTMRLRATGVLETIWNKTEADHMRNLDLFNKIGGR